MLKQIISESNVRQVRRLLEESERIVITCHKSPDGDEMVPLWDWRTRLPTSEKKRKWSLLTGLRAIFAVFRE